MGRYSERQSRSRSPLRPPADAARRLSASVAAANANAAVHAAVNAAASGRGLPYGLPRAAPLRREPPAWIPPMLATLVEPRALPAGWLYEPKLDGVRCLAYVRGGEVRLLSRTRKPLDDAYPELVEALRRRARGDAILDGEIVAIDPERGVSSFALLQRRLGLHDAVRAVRAGVAVELWLFDCPFYEGLDIARLPLEDRRRVLRDAVRFGGPVRMTPVLAGPFESLYESACRQGAEGLIGKRAASRYSPGRSADWVKLKCVNEQEFVVGGWTDPKGSRTGLGALLVGYYDRTGRLQYAGKVGTGFDRATLTALARELARRERAGSPFGGGQPPNGSDVHWTAPALVAQVAFAEWTADGLLRHPRFIGVRHDRPAREVRREVLARRT